MKIVISFSFWGKSAAGGCNWALLMLVVVRENRRIDTTMQLARMCVRYRLVNLSGKFERILQRCR